MKIYLASSWRNNKQPEVVEALRNEGHEVYDFRNPEPGNHGFHWSDIDQKWKNWSKEEFRSALFHPVAEKGFGLDMKSLMECDVCVLVGPCGRSAHLEAGYAVGAGKITYILADEGEEPELMYRMAEVFTSLDEVISNLRDEEKKRKATIQDLQNELSSLGLSSGENHA